MSPSQTEPLSVWEILGEEYWRGADPPRDPDDCGDSEYAAALREFREKRAACRAAKGLEAAPANASYQAAELAFRRILMARLHAGKRTALCFSGGGIRSATFGLGVLQGLAAHSWSPKDPAKPPRLLAGVDYLSTVSGGGYLGGWFSAWAARHAQGSAGVVRELAAAPDAGWEPEPAPLRHLRRFSNYLNPELGAFSADTWTLAATVVRNIVLNWLVLLPLLAAFLMLPRVFLATVVQYPWIPTGYLLYPAAALLVAGVAYMIIDLPSAGDARLSQARFVLFGFVPLLLSAFGFSLYWAWLGDLQKEPGPAGCVAYGVGVMALGVAAGLAFAVWKYHEFRPAWLWKGLAFSMVTGAVGGLFTFWMTWRFTDPATGDLYDDRLYAWLAVPTLLGIFALAQGLLVALTSNIAEDEDREWWARALAWLFASMVCYFALSGVVLMTPVLAHRLPPIEWQALATAAAGFLASRLGLSASVCATKENKDPNKAQLKASLSQLAARFAPKLVMPVFLLLLVGLIATFNEKASHLLTVWLHRPPSWSPFHAVHKPIAPLVELLLAALLAIPALILSRFIDANKFSLHAMYRVRLIRTFLGASNSHRKPHPFTGFDPHDNLSMADLSPRPLHVVNATLNLVKGENLAWQQRKAESFTSTKYRTGSCRLGYQESRVYADRISLGGAIAISGAAANPNMGYASSPLLSVVMMLFNARLGAWRPNPGEPGRGYWSKPGPTYSVRPFIDEAFGLTNDKNTWVNLSDGGHFENLGLYEMVLRRCATIIVVDGSQDPSFHFDDLGNATRKIRVDMGIPIEFRDGLSIAREITAASRHCAVGRIVYSTVDGQGVKDGTLIYIKASLTGNEPRDVLTYAAENPAFPHQSTADQWFDESQFESYRRLGYHVVEEIFQFRDDVASIGEFTDAVRSYLNPHAATPPAAPGAPSSGGAAGTP
jgi:hypothetical protein